VGWWRLTVAYAMVIAILAVLPFPAPRVSGVSLDKLLHLCEYLLLAWCVVQAARASKFPHLKTLTVAFLLSVSWGVILEGVQGWLPYRQAEWLDVVANTLGAGLGAWIGVMRRREGSP